MGSSILAFMQALAPYIPLALWGVRTAKETLIWGFNSLAGMIEEGRDPTEEEWLRVRGKRKELLDKLTRDDI